MYSRMDACGRKIVGVHCCTVVWFNTNLDVVMQELGDVISSTELAHSTGDSALSEYHPWLETNKCLEKTWDSLHKIELQLKNRGMRTWAEPLASQPAMKNMDSR